MEPNGTKGGMMTVQTPKREFWNNAEPERLPDAVIV